jgi:hypothetical protein
MCWRRASTWAAMGDDARQIVSARSAKNMIPNWSYEFHRRGSCMQCFCAYLRRELWQIKKRFKCRDGRQLGPIPGRCARQAFENLETGLRAGGSRSDLVANASIPAQLYIRGVFPCKSTRPHGDAGSSAEGLLLSSGCVAIPCPEGQVSFTTCPPLNPVARAHPTVKMFSSSASQFF